jgi:hypothetical protein
MCSIAATELPNRRFGEFRAVEQSLRALVGELDPDGVPLAHVTQLWKALDAIERLAGSAKTLLARRVEETGAWQREGYRSPAEHLAAVAGTSVSAARRQLDTSTQVEVLAATADAMRAGKLSAAKTEVVAKAATLAPEAESGLLRKAAQAPLADVREECLRAQARINREATHERILRERFVREWTDAEGAWNLIARGTVDDGARFRAAFEPIVEAKFHQARAEGRNEPREAYAFDALITLAERADPRTGTRTRAPRFMALIRVDHEALQRGVVESDETCEIAGLGPIPVRVARDLLGDAIMQLVVTKGVDVVNVTNLRRSATTAQRVALWWQAPMCKIEGCTRTKRLEIDHHKGWANTRRTDVRDLGNLCDHHHDLKTYNGWDFAQGTNCTVLVAPDDPRHPRNRPPPDR